MDSHEVEVYLHEHIPLSRSMEVGVVDATATGVTLEAPLAPNINHRDTVFGGSASAVAILAAWALVRVLLEQEGLEARIVIQRNTMEYLLPIVEEFTASSSIKDPAQVKRFLDTFRRKGRGRISVAVTLCCQGRRVAEFDGAFVALSHSSQAS